MYQDKRTCERQSDVYPPHSPYEVQEVISAEAILLVNEPDRDVDESSRAHRVATNVQALHRVPDHERPDVGEYGVSCYSQSIEYYKKREVEEEEDVGEYPECFRGVVVRVIVEKNGDGPRT